MKQSPANLGSGETLLAEVPAPVASPGQVLVRTCRSLVSVGTERMLLEFGRANWLEKARQQPDKVTQVLQKIRTDGLLPTLDAVRSKLDQPIALGYSNAGVAVEVGSGAEGFVSGDRVLSNGPHAEYVCVPKNLCARIPDAVSFDHAAFGVVGAIGLQGIRLLGPALGESVVVTGLGLIGLLCVQMLRANGCRVLGMDPDTAKCALARQFGAETVALGPQVDAVEVALGWTGGRGVDGVLIAASTSSSEPVHQGAKMCRKRGRIVLVGVTGLELARADFYEKELTFQVSCSYGPGRYDPDYEQKGRDYPYGLVRWTEQRNFEAFLGLLAQRRLDLDPLITQRVPLDRALSAYDKLGRDRALGILLEYDLGPSGSERGTTLGQPLGQSARTVALSEANPLATLSAQPTHRAVVIGLIGAGNYTGQVLLPALRRTGVRLKTIASVVGAMAAHQGRKFGFEHATTESESVFQDPEINAVLLTTYHDSHAPLVVRGLRAGQRVFVEKPLCLSRAQLEAVRAAHAAARNPFLMVGYNRRFAPQTARIKSLLAARREPRVFVFTANAGRVPPSHWTQDPAVGGGRILGEACHYIDLLRHLAGAPVVSADAVFAHGVGAECGDTATLQLRFADGSIGTVHYLANGSKAFPKERLEIFCGGGVLQLDNFRVLRGFGWPGCGRDRLWRQDKGHGAEMAALAAALAAGEPSPIPFEELIEVAEVSLRLAAGESYRR